MDGFNLKRWETKIRKLKKDLKYLEDTGIIKMELTTSSFWLVLGENINSITLLDITLIENDRYIIVGANEDNPRGFKVCVFKNKADYLADDYMASYGEYFDKNKTEVIETINYSRRRK